MPSDVEQGSDPRGTPMDGTHSMEDVKEQTVEVADLKAQQVSPRMSLESDFFSPRCFLLPRGETTPNPSATGRKAHQGRYGGPRQARRQAHGHDGFRRARCGESARNHGWPPHRRSVTFISPPQKKNEVIAMFMTSFLELLNEASDGKPARPRAPRLHATR